MTSPLFSVVHNIPSPYRLHLFEALSSELAARGVDLEVHYMARGHGDRLHWTGLDQGISTPHRFWRDWGVRQGMKEWHFNPGLVAHLLWSRPHYLLVGGPWDSLTGVLMSLIARRSISIAWFEGNRATPGQTRGVVGCIKRYLLSRYRFIAVPGQEGAAVAEMIAGRRALGRLAFLPNLVDESLFGCAGKWNRQEMRRELGAEASTRLALWPARLIPAKGVVQFLEAIRNVDFGRWRIIVVGDGPLRGEIEKTIVDCGLTARVRLMEPWPYRRMPEVYAASDLFLLPSINDPNPLSVVEAMHSGLPLAISRRIGNASEALLEGINGWSFDPKDAIQVQKAMTECFSANDFTLEKMGQASRARAVEHWSTASAVSRFVDSVIPDSKRGRNGGPVRTA